MTPSDLAARFKEQDRRLAELELRLNVIEGRWPSSPVAWLDWWSQQCEITQRKMMEMFRR